MPSFPASLPSPTYEGYQEQLQNTVIRTQMDAGPAKVRRRATAAVRPLSLRWVLTEAQLETFISFFEDEVVGGSIAFDMTHPRKGIERSFRFDLSQGAPAISVLSEDDYSVTASLEEMP
jgi:hypothetical protein